MGLACASRIAREEPELSGMIRHWDKTFVLSDVRTASGRLAISSIVLFELWYGAAVGAPVEATPAVRCRSSLRRHPILKLEPRHAPEFAPICGHQQRAAPSRLCGNEHVVGANRRSSALQRRADI